MSWSHQLIRHCPQDRQSEETKQHRFTQLTKPIMRNQRTKTMRSTFGSMLAGAVLLAPQITSAQNFDFMDGCNWADSRDNYVNGIIVLSGTQTWHTEAVHKAKAKQLAGYAKNRGMNSIRVPCNPDTIANSGQWGKFQERVSGMTGEDVNVLICHWDGAGSNKDGELDDRDDWDTMWQTIDTKYKWWNKVYFSPFNEPFGLGKNTLANLQGDFLDDTVKPKGKVLINGTGYDDNVKEIAEFSRFNGCGFSQHIYPWYANHSTNAKWREEVKNRVGSSYYSRTVVTEFGNQTISSRDYQSGSTGDGSVEFVRGVTQACKGTNMGCMWWPGWRDGDSFRAWEGTNADTARNESLFDRLEYGFD